MRRRGTILVATVMGCGAALVLLALGAVEAAGTLPSVQAAACQRLQQELAARSDAAIVTACGRISVWRGSWSVAGIGIEPEQADLTLSAASARIDWAPRWGRPYIKVREVELQDAALRSLDGRWSLTGLHVVVADVLDSQARVRADGLPRLCHKPTGAFQRCFTLEDFRGLAQRAGDEAEGAVEFGVDGVARTAVSGRMLDEALLLDARVDVESYTRLVATVAPDLEPLQELGLDAPFTITARLEGDRSDPGSLALDLDVDLDEMRRRARHAEAGSDLEGPFAFRPTVVDDAPELVMGVESGSFVALADLADHTVKAVLYAEDAGFFRHPGFEETEILGALQANLAAGGVRRGASTITQQLAKNLWLSPDRTLERKVHEALATLALEAILDKERILEIYLNSIEWGPGIFGVDQAARHYFGVAPRELTPRQSAFLASIIPNPRRYHRYCRDGELTDTWRNRVVDILTLLRDRDVITDFDYEDALEETLVFTSEHPETLAAVAEPTLR